MEVVAETVYTSFPFDRNAKGQEQDDYHDFKSMIDFETRLKGAPTFSLSERSYLSRAILLVPRAIGYSAGFIDHFFRGSFDIRWIRSGDRWDMKLTNTSAELIGPDAMIESVFTAEPSYFGGSSGDTAHILPKAKISDYVPGFNGLQPGQTITIPQVRPAELHAGDSLRAHDRRTVITGSLGDETDAVIGLVQQGGPHRLRAEISWNDYGDPGPMIGTLSDPGPCSRFIGPVYSYMSPFCLGPAESRACITQVPAPEVAATAVFTIDKTNPDEDYRFSFLNTYGGTAHVTLKIFIDDELDRTINTAVDMRYTGSCPQFAQYP